MTAKVFKSTEREEKQHNLKEITKGIIKKKKRKADKSLKKKELKAFRIIKNKELKAIKKKLIAEKKAVKGIERANTGIRKKSVTEKKAVKGIKRANTGIKKKLITEKKAVKGIKRKEQICKKANPLLPINMNDNENLEKEEMHKSIAQMKAVSKHRKLLAQREKDLVLDLFGDGVDVTDNEEAAIAPVVFKKKLRKSTDDDDINIPEDPYDIHHMEVLEPKKKPAWVDEDDMNIRVMDVVANMTKFRGQRGIKEDSIKKYEAELREKFGQSIGSTPDWAELKENSKVDSDDDEMVRSTGNYLTGESSFNLPKMSLEYKQMNDLNSSHTEGAFIQAIAFNPHLQVGLVAGSLKNLGSASLFQVDGKANHRIHSVRFPSYPITCARFMQDGKKFVVASDLYSHFFVYDMETSKETKLYISKKFEKRAKENLYVSPDGELLIYLSSKGKIYVYDTATFSLIDTIEAPHNVTSATFNADGSRMYTHGLTGEVCVWDMHARECVHKFYDEGCIAGHAIAMSPNNQYLACGSRSGIVNVYDSAELSTSSPMPVKVLSNLTTSVTALTFNASSEILAMASNHLPNAMKLVHFPSMTVFENFPRPGSIMKQFGALQFSPQSGYLAVGNYSGAAALYRLKHFSSY